MWLTYALGVATKIWLGAKVVVLKLALDPLSTIKIATKPLYSMFYYIVQPVAGIREI